MTPRKATRAEIVKASLGLFVVAGVQYGPDWNLPDPWFTIAVALAVVVMLYSICYQLLLVKIRYENQTARKW